MTKIEFILEKPNAPSVKKTLSTSPDLFKSTLTQAIENESSAAGDVSEIPPLGEIRSITCCQDALPGTEVTILEKADDLLDLLDQYSAKISDPGQSLKDIEPLINSIRNQADELVKESGTGSASDPRLQKFVRDCSLTATMEWYKFNRGDYV